MPGVQNVTVTAAEHGQKLLQFLQRRLGGTAPKSMLMRIIRTGQVRVDKGRAKPFQRIEKGQTIRIPPVRLDGEEGSAKGTKSQTTAPETNKEPQSRGTPSSLYVIHEAPGFIAIAKPAGLPVQPGTGHTDAVSERLRAMYADAPFIPTPAHRLDRDTSGILLAGTTYKGLRTLQEAFKEHTLHKDYLAWVQARMKPGTTLELIDQMKKRGEKGRQRVETGRGKQALARARCVAERDGLALLEIRLFTGRTHQIRVQLASRGMPIVGDRKYGYVGKVKAMKLHAWAVEWPDGERIEQLPGWGGRFRVGKEDFA